MHVEKIQGEYFVIKSDKKIAGPFQLRDTAIARMREIARETKHRFLI